MNMNLTIGQAAREAGCKVQTLRYYEELGLLPKPQRTAGNQRVYGEEHLRRLAFIRHARELGFSLDAVRELLSLGARPDQSCAKADRIASEHLDEIERKIAALTALKGELARMVESCKQGPISECRVIEVLADHSHAHCVSDAHARPPAQNALAMEPLKR
jgi:DNA-binding transcriptional MerR regulator